MGSWSVGGGGRVGRGDGLLGCDGCGGTVGVPLRVGRGVVGRGDGLGRPVVGRGAGAGDPDAGTPTTGVVVGTRGVGAPGGGVAPTDAVAPGEVVGVVIPDPREPTTLPTPPDLRGSDPVKPASGPAGPPASRVRAVTAQSPPAATPSACSALTADP